MKNNCLCPKYSSTTPLFRQGIIKNFYIFIFSGICVIINLYNYNYQTKVFLTDGCKGIEWICDACPAYQGRKEEMLMALMNSSVVLGYLMSTYGGDKAHSSSKYDAHKKSELRDVYNRMVRSNKNSPIYKINYTPQVAEFAIDIKVKAHDMENIVLRMGGGDEGIESVLNEKKAYSSNENAVGVEYVGDQDSETDTSQTFTVDVRSLATPQINEGAPLVKDAHDIDPGSYSFDLDTTNGSYEFQYNVNNGDTNLDIQKKIMRLINTSDTGLTADIKDFGRMSSLIVASKQTGLSSNEKYLFNISSGASWNELKTLGIGRITHPAEDSTFYLNGDEHHSLSNIFTINQSFALTLKDTTKEGEPAIIGFKADTDMIADSVNDLVDSYNSFLAVGQKYQNTESSSGLLKEITNIGNSLGHELSEIGISTDEFGMLSVDREALDDAVSGADMKKTCHNINMFKSALHREAEKSSTNPMRYVKKLTIEYRNPNAGKNFPAVYAMSPYSGMLVDLQL